MKRRLFTFSFLAIGLIVIVFLIFRPSKTQTVTQEKIIGDVPVSVMQAKKGKISNSISLIGVIQANKDINVISETQGLVTAVRVKVGDNVHQETVLAEVDDVIMQSNLASAEINYLKAKRDYERSEVLFQENSISASQLDLARLQLKAAENQLTVAKKQLNNTKITTPVTGTINTRNVEVGTMVQPGMVIANVVDISTLKVKLNISEREAFQIRPGDKVEVTTDVYPGVSFRGNVDNIASKADEAHTYAVELKLQNSKEHPLKAGMFARANFNSSDERDAILIPREALIGSIRNAQVYLIKNSQALLQPVTIGRQAGQELEVIDGIAEGDVIVTNGQYNLSNNSRVVKINN
ncbi:MAG: efflux RND transporter periplasmic adaptor subunit [Ignavibacteria bacterium]|jgi:RND family efflux transporter MFP subunit|nr:efflux RND transporter periplasmic adaptor subunit [Ignavibacteria bacterium]MCU7519173.1 efflux RND transporter periplasmic adaptor subunit [Ignavibacteria bacterium]MCU7526315.1 efflux RND transporter periplasmic adaptor subunit [Ignavibacteria bacterium]